MAEEFQVKMIYKQQLAGYLMQHGCPLLGVMPSTKRLGMNVFLFEKNEKFEKVLETYNTLEAFNKKSKGDSKWGRKAEKQSNVNSAEQK